MNKIEYFHNFETLMFSYIIYSYLYSAFRILTQKKTITFYWPYLSHCVIIAFQVLLSLYINLNGQYEESISDFNGFVGLVLFPPLLLLLLTIILIPKFKNKFIDLKVIFFKISEKKFFFIIFFIYLVLSYINISYDFESQLANNVIIKFYLFGHIFYIGLIFYLIFVNYEWVIKLSGIMGIILCLLLSFII